MSLEGGKVLYYGEDGKIKKIFEPNEKIFTIGYYVSCDVIHEHPEVKGIHCEIACDSFGRITVKNYCETRPIIVNGEAVTGTRPLVPGSTIEVVGKQFRWEYQPPSKKEDAIQATPDGKANKVQPAPNSEPSALVCRAVQKRLTVHSFAYGLNSNREEDTENPYKCTIIQPLQMNTNKEIEENQSSANLIDFASNNENCTPKRRLSTCSHSDLVFTSYSPRPGLNTPKGFASVTPAKKISKSFCAAPRSALSEYNQSANSKEFTTPKGGSSKITATSMYLIDLITPLKPSRTPIKRTPLLKSALKNSVKGSAKDKAKKPLSCSSGTNFQGRKIVLETPVKKRSVSTTPKKSEQEQAAEGESNVVLLDSITEQSTINTDSVFGNDSSVIEIPSDCTPSRLERKKQLKTPQLVARKAISTSARKVRTTEKDFAKKIKNNIERISENLPIISNIGNIKNRRSSLPVVSTVVGRPSSLSQSTTGKLSKPTTTPQRILTTSTPFRSQKSIPKMKQSTLLKPADLMESFKRHSCISSNQTTPKVATKTPQKGIIKSQETETPKKDNRSVLFTDKLDKSVNEIKEHEEDALNATFTIDEEKEHSNGNKNGSENNQSQILELPLEKIGDFAKSDCLKDEEEHIQPIVDEEIQGIDIPGQTNISKISKASDNKSGLNKVSDNKGIQSSEISSNPFTACFTIELPKNLQTPNVITRSFRKHIAEHTPVDTDLKGLKDILETPRTLNRTPVKEVFKTPKVEESESKEECVIKRLMKTPVNIPKALAAKQFYIIPKVTREENVDIKEIVRVPSVVKDFQNNFVDLEEINTLAGISSPQKNEFEPSLKRSVCKMSTEVQTLDVLDDNKSFTKLFHDRYLENPTTSATEPKSPEPKSNIKTPKEKPVDMEDYAKLQSGDILENSDFLNTSAIRRPSTFNIEIPEKLETLGISVNAEIQNTQASTGHDTLQGKLRRSSAYKITLKNITKVQSSEITENENLVLSTPASEHEHIQRKVLETNSFNMKTPSNLHTPQKTICSKNANEVQRSEKSANAKIPNTPVSGLGSGQRKLRRSLHTKTETPKNLQTQKKLIDLRNEAEFSKNADISSTKLQIKEIEENLDFPNTPITTYEPIQRKLWRSNTFDVGEVPKKMQTPGIGTDLEDNAEIQSCKKSDIPSISAPRCEPIEKRLPRSSMVKTKIPTHSLDSTSPDYEEIEENVDIPVEQSISKAETSTNQQTETPIVLENNTETQTGAVTGHSGTKGALVAFKPVLGIIRKITNSKMKTMINPPTPETSLVLEDDAEVERTEISENVDISTPDAEVQGNFQTPTISEAGTSIHLQTLETSMVLEYDAEAQRVKNPENANIPSTPIQVHNELQRSSISKAESQINLQISEISRTSKCDAETQIGQISEHPDITRTQVSPISKINIPKRHSFMVIGQKMSAVKRFKGSKKESRRHTIGPSIKKYLSEPSNDDNLLKTNLVAFSKNFNIVGKSVFTLKKIPSNDNFKLEHNAEDKDKSFSSLSEDIESSDVPIKKKTPKAKPRKLFKSATFIIDSLKRPTISNSSSQKELTDSGLGYTLTENVNRSKQLLKSPKERNQTPVPKESPKLPKTLQTPRPLGVKELFNTPKPSKDINFVGIKELMKTPKVARDSDDNYHCLNELLKTPEDSKKYNETPYKSFKYDESCELGDYETLLIEDESYTHSPTSSQAEDERNSQVKHEGVLGRNISYPTTPIDELKSSSSKPRKYMNFFTETKEDVCSTGSVSTSMRELEKDQMEEFEFSNTEMYICPNTPVVGVKNNISKTGKSAVFYIETEEDVCSSESLKTPIGECLQDQLEEYESSDNTTDVTRRKRLLKTPNCINISPKSQKEGKILGVKETLSDSKDPEKTTVKGGKGAKGLLNTPKNGSFEDIRELGLKGLMKTPIKTPKPVRIKELFYTPKPEKEENLAGVKELMHEPKNLDQTVVMLGVKELLNTPEDETSNEIRELGLKRLMKTPIKTPKPVRIKELFYTPKPDKEDNLVGVKQLMHTPKNLDQTTILVGTKELLKTPKKIKSPIPLVIKEMFNRSSTEKEACLRSIKELMKTPESLKYADINLTGVNELLEAPKSDTNTEDFLGMPEMFSTPHQKDEDLRKTLISEFPDQEINQMSLSPKNLSARKQISDLAFKTPSAKMVMVLGTPQSVNINTAKLISSASPPPLYDLKENMEDIEEVFPTAVIDEESDTLSTEESFDKLVGKPFVRKSYGRSRISQNNSSFAAQLNNKKENELSKWVENASLVLSSAEIDENSRDVSDNAAAFSMSGIKTLERDEELEEMEILQNSQDESIRNNVKIATDLIPINIVSPETTTLKKTENKNVGTKMEYKKDDPPEKKEENSQTDSDVVHSESIKYVDENVVEEEKEEETKIISNDDDEFPATTYTRSRRGRSRNVKLPQKQKLKDTVPKETKIKRGRKKDDIIEEKLEIIAPSVELMQAPDSTKIEFKKDVEVQVDRNHSEIKLDSIKESENILEVKATRRETRKRNVLNNDTGKEETIHGNPESANQLKRVTRNKKNLKTQIPDEQKSIPIDENQCNFIKEVGRRGRRGKVVRFVEAKLIENVHDEVLVVEEANREDSKELGKEEEIKIPQSEKVVVSTTALHTTDPNEDLEEDGDKKENISSNLSSSDETKKPFSLPILIKTHGRRNVVVVSPKTKSVTVQKRKSDSESEEAVVPLKRMVRKRSVNITENKSEQLNLEIKAVTRPKADNVLDYIQPNLSRKEFEDAVTPSEQGTVKDKQESVLVYTENFDKATKIGEMGNLSEDIENAKVEITPPRTGRAKRKADNNLNNIQQNSSSTESEAPPVRRGKPRRKADTVEPQEQIPGHKTENTTLRRGTRRKVEDLVDNAQALAVLTPPQRGRARRKVEEPKAERAKTNNLLNKSADELTPIKPEILKNLSEEKENVSTPKIQPDDVLEFKTPISAAPRARRVLRSNSTSVQVSTPILQEHNHQETIVTNDSVEKIESSLPAAASTRTRSRRRLNSTRNEVEALETDVEKLETSLRGLPAAKSGRTRGRPRINSTCKEEVQILNEFETSDNAISVATTGRIRGRKRINSTKDEVKMADVNVEHPETFRKTRGRKKADITKEEMKALDVEVKQLEMSEILPTAAITTRTRGKKRINSIKEEVQIVDEEKKHPEISAKNPSSVATSGRTRARRNVNSTKN